jgi:mono/diheme cytochrome c family protein
MTRTALVLILAGWAGLACSRTHNKTAAAADPAAQKQAEEIFANRCTPCHGQNGKGDGPASASLNPHPRNFHDGAWHKTVTDEHIDKIIQYGGSAVGRSAAMPANPDLGGKPDVIAALRTKIRGFASQ